MTQRSLSDRLRPLPVGEDVFRGRAALLPPRIYGGEIAAQSIAAADCTVGDDRSAHAVQCTYLRPGDPSLPVDYRVSRTRDGRSFSTRTVSAVQAGEVIQQATVGYHIADDGVAHQASMPDVPGPDQFHDMRHQGDGVERVWGDWAPGVDGFELRPVTPDRSDPLGRRRVWSRFDMDPCPSTQGAVFVTYASDMTMLASVRLPHEPTLAKSFLTTTLTHTVYFHRAHDPSRWLLWDHYSPVAGGARGLAIAHAFDAEGHLVATAVQEGLARPAK